MSYKMLKTILLINLICCCVFSKALYAGIPVTTDTRIKTFVYTPNEIFQLKFHYNYQSYIEFPEHEKIDLIAVGDRFAWNIKKVHNRLFIKPQQSGVETNMTIMTNKHIYHFDIVSSTKSYNEVDDDLVIVAKFFYPEKTYDYMETIRIRKPLNETNIQKPQATPNKNLPSANRVDEIAKEILAAQEVGERQPDIEAQVSVIDTKKINFRYSMVGSESAITPTQVYDDGKNTFFEFADNTLPDIFRVNSEGVETLAQYIIEERTIKVLGRAKQYSLRSNNDLLCIFNENIN